MKKRLLLVFIFTLSLSMLFACGKKSESANKSYTVKVTKINNGKYTADVGKINKAENPSDEFFDMHTHTHGMPMHTFDPNMQKPTFEPKFDAKPDGAVGNDGIKPPPDKGMELRPFESEKPFGEMPPEFFENSVEFVFSGESITFEIADGAEILKNNRAVSVSEITVESILNITLDSKGNAAKIDILY